ncbi:tetratricopeptide repeat protein [Lewinella sp. LCG006]|uniref:tetratricopeptide repeat protein n=1 Tax=Lewinella sp. LCG006 TaxID=3231911 RepID=UPI00345FDCB2
MSTKNKKNNTKKTKTLPAAWAWLGRTRLVAGGLFLLSVVLYANTFSHDFAQDDAIVITENMFTTEGVAGIPGLFQYDTFYGFFKVEGKAKLVAGGRYRPLTPAMFAVEYGLFNANPAVMHVFNALWYGLTVVMLYLLLLAMFQARKSWDREINLLAVYWIPLLAAFLFAVHPLHTEAVANIKGRDEIITLLGSLTSLWLLFKGGTLRTALAGVCFFLALLAKENAITFLGVAPLALFVFTPTKMGDIVKRISPLLAATLVFLMIRGSILGWDAGPPSQELMNNPFLKLEQGRWVDFSGSEKAATITYTLGKYAQLLVAPVQLTHDYYPRQIDIMRFNDWRVLLSLFLYLGLLVYGLWGLLRKNIGSFAVLYYLGTLSLVSNIVFPVGTNMSERFLFMPSVGFTLLVAWGLFTYLKNHRLATGIALAFGGILMVLTFLRNPAWKDNYTLFTTDIYTSPNSAKLRNAMAGELSVQWAALPPEQQQVRQSMLQEALGHIEEAIRIHPTYKQAYFIKGNVLNYLKQYEASIQAYQQARQIDPGYEQAFDNLMITYRDAGRYYGEQKGDIRTAIQYLEQAYQAMPEDYETIRLLGVANGIAGNTPRTIELFTKNTQLQPNNARAWYDLGTAYRNNQQAEAAEQALQKARQLDPDIETKVRSGN